MSWDRQTAFEKALENKLVPLLSHATHWVGKDHPSNRSDSITDVLLTIRDTLKSIDKKLSRESQQ